MTATWSSALRAGAGSRHRPAGPPNHCGRLTDRAGASVAPLPTPSQLIADLPLSECARETVQRGRSAVRAGLAGDDDRLLIMSGPCSIHDRIAALEYAARLADVAERLSGELLIVMRSYFEKPRTVLGWKGMIYDPLLDGSGCVEEGLRTARQLLLQFAERQVPVGCEFLDPITPRYFSDLVTWGTIGARTVESQIHRQLASGLSMPVGMKNRGDGDTQVAIDAVAAAGAPHVCLDIADDGRVSVVTTRGNAHCHVVLRGGATGSNHDRSSVQEVLTRLRAAGLPERVVIDASHGNSGKDYRRQPDVAAAIAAQLAAGETGIVGVMLESFLVDGRQDIATSPAQLTYGQSVTDGCMGWPMTVDTLEMLAEAVLARRSRRAWMTA
jgi:3-deoxy-7-phosphoheptulonate synthase